MITGANWTFGFVEGQVNSDGSISSAKAGGIPYDFPADSGEGVGGSGTNNDWVFTPESGGAITTITVGTTFGTNGTYILNSGSDANFDRTYSANANGVSSIAEPGTFSLITGAGLVLAGLFR